jgi:NTE family protein
VSVALVLSGGGARACYQVGVLRAIDEILSHPSRSPFTVICGTSAGAINASLLACESDRFSDSVELLNSIWGRLESSKVHEVHLGAVLSGLLSLVRSFYSHGYTPEPWSLFRNGPLRRLLKRRVRFGRLRERFAAGDIDALSMTVLGYTSGDSISFFDGTGDLKGWRRHRRVGARVELDLNYLMASTAIPGIYPSVRIHREYFGDGAVRQTSPLSPALHLGARKLFVIGVSHNPLERASPREETSHTPSLAQMTSHFLNGSFVDALEEDMESLARLNDVIAYLSPAEQQQLNLARVDVMSVTPTKAFDKIAAAHCDSLPLMVRFLFKVLGATHEGGGASLASYLMFEQGFIQEMIACGYSDAMAQRDAIEKFLGAPG